MKQNKIYIYGKHALLEALRNSPSSIDRVYLESAVQDREKELVHLIQSNDIMLSNLDSRRDTKGLAKDTVHQGVIGRLKVDKLLLEYGDFINKLTITPDTSLLILGEIEDPHNVGAIIRSAAAFGASGVLIPKHKQASISGAVVKASAGMVFTIPVVEIGNVNTTIRDLQKRDFWAYGLDASAQTRVDEEKYSKPSVFVVGNESKGVREKTKEACDILLKIPMNKRCESLNVAASAAVTLFAWSKQHPEALNK